MTLQMPYTPDGFDAPITTIWDLQDLHVSFQNGVLQTIEILLNPYPAKADIGVKAPLDQPHRVTATAQQVGEVLAAAGIAPGALQTLAYALAQTVQDTQTGVDKNGNPIMGNFFANATLV